MGCWNETDGITQLPIESSDKVRLFVLISQNHWGDNASGGGTCYSNDIWDVFGPPIEGTYDNYGGIENIVENENTNLLLKRIREYWMPFIDEYDQVTPIETMPLAEVLHWIERDKGKTQRYGQMNYFGMLMIHEEMYQAMISYNPVQAFHYHSGGYEYLPLRDGITNDLRDWYQTCVQNYAEIKDTSGAKFIMSMSDSHFFGYKESGIRLYKDVLSELIYKGESWESDVVQQVARPLVEMSVFNAAFRAARKMWHPQCGKGSQNSDVDVYKVINLAVDKVIKQKEAAHEEYRDAPFDENGYAPWMIEHNIEFRAKKDSDSEKDI